MRVDLYPPLCNAALLAHAAGGTLTVFGRPAPPRGVSTDSRTVCPGDLFAALPGQRTRGSDHMAAAVSAGAVAVLTDVLPPEPLADCAVILVPDVAVALLKWAAFRRRMTRARVIGVSGSTGKTTAKEGLYHLLKTVGTVSRTAGNYNSGVGMPLSVLSFGETDDWVVEIGVNHPGEMAPMARALAPDAAVLTNVGSAHIGHFGSAGALLAEKAALTCGMSEKGLLFAPAELKNELKHVVPRLVTWGEGGDFTAFAVRQDPGGVTLSAAGRGRVLRDLHWPLPGRVGVAQVLLLTAAGVTLGLDDGALRAGIEAAGQNTPRLRRYFAGDRLLLDDTYNASPEAMAAALETLRCMAGERPTVAVLGDMLELGDSAESMHEAVGKTAAKSGLYMLWCCGQFAETMANGAKKAGFPAERIRTAAGVDAAGLARELRQYAPRNAVVLFKASHAVGLDEAVNAMKSERD